jgi:hypothetical protein
MRKLAFLLLTLLFAVPAAAQDQVTPGAPVAKPPAARTAAQKPSRSAAQTPQQQAAAMGDLSGGRFIPPPILQILADRRIDPNIAYILWQFTGGSGNVQTSVQNGGSGNVVVQTQQGSGNSQTVIQTGNGNRAVQIQSGHGHSGTLEQHGRKTDVQIQD